MKKTFQEHLDPNFGSKNILSLDGGGIRGALTLGYLKKIETILREKHGKDYLLCDHFDLIGGTSTGSIIAAALAVGKSVDEIVDLYMDLGGKIFGKKRSFWNPLETWKFLKAGYDYKALEQSLKGAFGDITLESDEIKTGLCIVAKRADTNSVWPIINHPKGKFYDTNMGKNKNIALWQAVRASSAAPTYFAPQMIDVGDGQRAAFVDGGVSMANNPALTLLMVATLKGFPFRWDMGEDNLTIVSVGTGYSVFKKQTSEIEEAWLKTWATNVPDMLMQDASWQNQILLQWLSNSPTAQYIDMEIESLKDDFIGGKALLKYLRYNFPITENDLNGLGLGKTFNSKDVESLIEMSNAENRQELYDIGVAASNSVLKSHFD
ncbi:patatin-like phospholipase family protein [Mariniflexile sp. AS56]|uniref:patatin-like phospholipase family protein n=1 Tax=Mariniflexile sp. AS56 TaxID=3063957 RepID=UPI0026EB9C7E|nr:patatin-like phospholipase family protein [Mariniflexile sp. AS56]MDO7173833.1 patatin-like phospholipase family protein [Mariniflexile sp. AS56]